MYIRKQREGMACTVPSPKGIPHTQLVQLKMAQVYQSSIEQPSTHIIMYVFVLTMPARWHRQLWPCLQHHTVAFTKVGRLKYKNTMTKSRDPFNTYCYVYDQNNKNASQQCKASYSCCLGISLWHVSGKTGMSTMSVY